MAKKSAKSKGYRKTAQKRPYLTKKEILTAAAIAVAVLVGLLLFRLFYDDGSLKIVDGVPQTKGANSLLVNEGTGRAPVYFKLGQLTDVEGYTLSSEPSSGDENVLRFNYTPDAESAIDRITLATYPAGAELLGESTHATYVESENTTCSELQTMDLGDNKVTYFTLTILPSEEAASEETELDYTHLQALSAFISANDRCISMQVRNEAMSEDEFVDEAALVEAMNQVLAALSFETK